MNDNISIEYFICEMIILMALWGGVVKQLIKRPRNRLWEWRTLSRQIIISLFSGLLGALLGYELELSAYMIVIMAGVFSLADIKAIQKMHDIIFFRKNNIK